MFLVNKCQICQMKEKDNNRKGSKYYSDREIKESIKAKDNILIILETNAV